MKTLLTFAIVSFLFTMEAQVFVQLELFNDPSAKKYTVGDKITYKVDYQDDVWRKGVIEEILIKDNALVLNNDLITLEQVTDFMLYRNTANYIGRSLQTFGTLYSGWGVVGLIVGDVKLRQILSIGGTSFASGWLIRKLFYKVPVKIGEKNRLRIVDLRFYVPDDEKT